ncbi:MAG: HlyD family secretion protein [Parasphingorhabdus sp.]|jgi:HlyD family secretion protein
MKWFLSASAIVISLSVYFYFGGDKPLVVEFFQLASGEIEQTVANTRAGTIKACRRSRLSMPIGGRVSELNVQEGDRVKEGELLLELWNKDRIALLDKAKASHETAQIKQRQFCLTAEHDRRDLDRVKQLFAKRLTSEEYLDGTANKAESSAITCEAATAESRVAQANIRVHQSMLEQTYLRAPFDGVVAEINGEIGEYVTPSPPGVLTPPAVDLIDNTCLYVTAPIDEVDAALIDIELEARITLDAFRSRQFSGKVRRIASYVVDLEKQARTVDVEVDFLEPPEDHLLVGYSADIEVVIQSRSDALRVPTQAVVDGNSLWVAENGLAIKREFERGLSNWNWTEVASGLKEGDSVIVSIDVEGLREGIMVTAGER